MRLVRFSRDGGDPRLGVLDDGHVLDLSESAPDLPADCGALLAEPDWIGRASAAAAATRVTAAVSDVSLLTPLPRPGKIICIGLNYRSHLEEIGVDMPADPTVFAKYASSIIGPGDAIVLPAPAAKRVDYEAELAVVIGGHGKDVPAERAMDLVAGYTAANDVSARDWQLRKSGGQWLLGKTFDTFLPLGPALVTADEIDDPGALRVTCRVSGELLQDGNTSEMLFDIPTLVSHLSSVFRLEPGDVILTGTPAGVGMARDPRRFLRAGDLVEVSVEGVGTLSNAVQAA